MAFYHSLYERVLEKKPELLPYLVHLQYSTPKPKNYREVSVTHYIPDSYHRFSFSFPESNADVNVLYLSFSGLGYNKQTKAWETIFIHYFWVEIARPDFQQAFDFVLSTPFSDPITLDFEGEKLLAIVPQNLFFDRVVILYDPERVEKMKKAEKYLNLLPATYLKPKFFNPEEDETTEESLE